jgi:hypothetical protein
MTTTATPAGLPARTSGVSVFIRRRPLSAFFLWFFTVGQAFAFTPMIARHYGVTLFPQIFIDLSTVVGLLLPAVVITRVVDGPEKVRELWRRSFAVRVRPRWYVLALVVVPALSTAIALGLEGPPRSGVPILPALLAGLGLHLLLTFVLNNWWEEVAWTGFVQARLQDRYGSALRAAVVAAPLFALQHVSLVVGNGVVLGVALMVFLTVLSMPYRIVNAWMFNRTGSLFLVGLVHAVGDAAVVGSGFGPGFLLRLYPAEHGPFFGAAHIFALAVVGLLALAATRGRLGLRGSEATR